MPRVLRLVAPTLAALLLLGPPAARPAAAQQNIEIKATPPEEGMVRPEILPPPGARAITRPREADFYPEDIRVRIDPAFIEPFTILKQTGPKSAVRFGIAGWTSPNTPVPQGGGTYREIPGWFALGFALVWDVPVGPEGPVAPVPAPR